MPEHHHHQKRKLRVETTSIDDSLQNTPVILLMGWWELFYSGHSSPSYSTTISSTSMNNNLLLSPSLYPFASALFTHLTFPLIHHNITPTFFHPLASTPLHSSISLLYNTYQHKWKKHFDNVRLVLYMCCQCLKHAIGHCVYDHSVASCSRGNGSLIYKYNTSYGISNFL